MRTKKKKKEKENEELYHVYYYNNNRQVHFEHIVIICQFEFDVNLIVRLNYY